MNILELLNSQLGGPVMERLGGVLGLDPAQAQRIGAALLPAQVATLTQHASSEAGAQRLLDLAAQVPRGSVQDLLASPERIGQVRQSGAALLPQLMGSHMEDAVAQVAAQTDSAPAGVQDMMQMVLPLILGVIGQQVGRLGLNAGSLGQLFSGGLGQPGGLGAAAAGVGGAAAGLGGVAAGLGKSVSGAAAGLGAGVAAGAAGLGSAAAGLGNTLGQATVSAGAGLGGGVVHTNPALGGKKGMGWLWTLPLLLLLLLGGWFLLRGQPVVAEHAATPGATETMPAGTFAFMTPAAGATLAAGAFDLTGMGKPGDVLEIFEDGVSLGKTTVGADGRWTLNVASPAAGAHSYSVKGAGGTELGTVQTTVAAAAASTAACTKAFSLSMKDGAAVAQPFRFGGVGSGRSYTVTVMRGERKIGSKVMPLDASCGYSYTSKPGKGTISYVVSPTGSADVASKITITVQE